MAEDGSGTKREVSRRRRVAVFTAVGLVAVAVPAVFQLSFHSVTRMQDTCTVSVPATEFNKASTIEFPCKPHDVTQLASWWSPVLVAVLVLIVGSTAVIWALMPRLTKPSSQHPADVEPLRGKPLRRSTTGYWLRPVQSLMMFVLGTAFVVGGLLLALLPSGAPFLVEALFVGSGVAICYSAGAGFVTVTPLCLTIRTGYRRKRWPWVTIEHIEVADSLMPPAGIKARMLVVSTTTGEVFANTTVSSLARQGAASRADRLAVALNLYRSALDTRTGVQFTS